MPKPVIKYYAFSTLFFLSGFAGLIYESVLTQYIKMLAGHAAFAQSFILIVFMGGLSVGAWAGNKLMKFSRLYFVYGLLEGLIGVWGILFHLFFKQVGFFLSTSVYPTFIGFSADFIQWGLIILLTFPITLMLGATFPVLAKALQRNSPSKPGAVLAQLYFVNSLGASLGVLFSAFVFMPNFGLPETLLIAGLLNGLIAIIARFFSVPFKKTSPKNRVKIQQAHSHTDRLKTLIMLIAVFTGTSSLMYEIGWVRLLSMVLGSSVQSFELMLSAFILGMAMGAWWIRSRIDRIQKPISFLISIQVLMGALLLVSLLGYNQLYTLLEWMLGMLGEDENSYFIFLTGSHAMAFLVMLPATIFAGMSLPLMIHILQRAGEDNSIIGKVYALDTAGGIVGVVLAVHFLMPLVGLKYMMIISAGIDMFAGWMLWQFYNSESTTFKKLSLPLFIFTVMLLAVVFFHPDPLKMSSGVFRYGQVSSGKEVLFHKDGKTATVAVSKTEGGNLILTINGKPDASINTLGMVSGDEATQVLLAALPMSLHTNPEQAAIIGLGSGKTAHVTLMNPAVKSLDVLEIEPAVVEASQYFRPWVGNVFVDGRAHLHLKDARSFLMTSSKSYDLIISEPSNPWVSGMSSLFTTEFYQTISTSLNEDGIFLQWIHSYEMNIGLMASVVKAFAPHFDDFAFYFLDDGDVALIGTKASQLGFPTRDIFKIDELKKALDGLGIRDVSELAIRYVGSKKTLQPYFESYPGSGNSDFYPVLEYEAPKARFLHESVAELSGLLSFPAPILRSMQAFPDIEIDSLGSDYSFSQSAKYQSAQVVYKMIEHLHRGEEPDFGGLDRYDSLVVQNIIRIRRVPAEFAFAENWYPYLKPFAEIIQPYLDREQLNFIWHWMESAPGWEYLREPHQNEIHLYTAVVNADYSGILELSATFIKNPPEELTINDTYRLTVSVWASMMSGQYEEARKLFEKYPLIVEQEPMLRLLYARMKGLEVPLD